VVWGGRSAMTVLTRLDGIVCLFTESIASLRIECSESELMVVR
jgi:hypothetical protein